MPILALSELLMQKMPEGTGEREDLETIVQASRHGRDLVRRILAFSRHQQVQRTRVDLAAITHQALQMLRPTIPATVLINEEIEDAPLILADPGQIQQVVVNLVTNAVQAIGDRMGTITVSLSPAIGSQSPTAISFACGLSIPGAAWTPRRETGFSSLSSQLRPSAKAPGSGFPSSTASSPIMAGRSRSAASPAREPSSPFSFLYPDRLQSLVEPAAA